MGAGSNECELDKPYIWPRRTKNRVLLVASPVNHTCHIGHSSQTKIEKAIQSSATHAPRRRLTSAWQELAVYITSLLFLPFRFCFVTICFLTNSF